MQHTSCVIQNVRKSGNHNSVSYAEQVIASVRSHYATLGGRRPSLYWDGTGGVRLKRVIKGLRKMCPTKKLVRKPILQHHLRAVRGKLDLKSNQMHRVIWALWLTQWQEVLRSSDLIKRDDDKNLPWLPDKETQRGRITADMGRDTEGRTTGAQLSLKLKPHKTNQTGEVMQVKTFIIDTNPEALSR